VGVPVVEVRWDVGIRSRLLPLASQVHAARNRKSAADQAPSRGNGKLKKLVAELSLDKAMLQDVLSRKF
jgi:hypothetical protein